MAKGASKETALGSLHVTLTKVFARVLEKYEKQMQALDTINPADLEEDMLSALMDMQEPNPAMLGAISKFLKDNEIMYDTEELTAMSAQERRLKDLRAARGSKVVSLQGLAVADG